MSESKPGRARKARRKTVKKPGLVALAAAALASPVATTPVIAESPSAVTPQPPAPSSTEAIGPPCNHIVDPDMDIDRQLNPLGGALVPEGPKTSVPAGTGTPGDTAILVGNTPRPSPGDGTGTNPALKLTPAPSQNDMQTLPVKPIPSSPATPDKALIYTGPSKPKN